MKVNQKKGGLPPLPPDELEVLRAYVAAQGLPAQVEAITCDAPLTVVSAGAGTGKTWTLAWRFVWTVLTRQGARRILTLTFTEKAASEMKSRIADLLRSLEPVLRNYPELSRRRAEALLALDQSYISTIHGFCMRVIGEAGLTLPLEPAQRVISEPETNEFWDELAGALDRLDVDWFCRGMDEEYVATARQILEDERIGDVVSTLGYENVAEFAKSLESMMGDFGYTPQDILDNAAVPDTRAIEALRELLDAEICGLAEMLSRGFDVDVTGKGAFVKKWGAFRDEWGSRPDDQDALRKFVFTACDVVKGAKGKLPEVIADAIGVKLTDWRKRALEIVKFDRLLANGWSENENALRSSLLRLAWLCWCRWQNYKESRGGITFSDMIALGGQTLKGDHDYASRFAEVLIDEFQDTNDQQDALLQCLANPRLFIVGDLKQSIYRFRHAEPALFQKYIAKAQRGEGRYIRLDISFRSNEAVLDAVNRRFRDIWKTRLGRGLDVPYEPLESPRCLASAQSWIDERQGTGLPVCELIVGEKRSGLPGEARRVRYNLALRLACRLSELRSNGAKVWGKGGLRPITWGDIAVLTPARSNYGALQDAFSAAEIPATFRDSRTFYARPEIRDVCALAAFLSDPRDRTALAGFLCSTFSGLAQPEAQAILPQLGTADPLESLKGIRPELARQLERAVSRALMQGPASGLGELLARGEILNRIHPRKRASAFANLRRAVTLLEDYESNMGSSPVGVAEYLRSALRRSATDPEAAAATGEDTVSVMTIHAAKGLEFPLVVMFGLEHASNAHDSGLRPSRTLLAAAPGLPESWKKTDDEECLLAEVDKYLERQAEYEELQRLYYVALTRARDGIILCGFVPKEGKGDVRDFTFRSIEKVVGDLAPSGEDVTEEQLAEVRRCNSGGSAAKVADGPTIRLNLHRPRRMSSFSATSWALWRMCPAAWRMNYRMALDLSWNAVSKSDSLAGGTELGDAAHWIMYHWDFTHEGYERLLGLNAGHLPPELRSVWRSEKARAALRSFLGGFETPEGQKLCGRLSDALRRKSLRREFPFRVALGSLELVGAVDAFWIEDGSDGKPACLCVRDYKTTRLPASAARRSWIDQFYAEQLQFYALALRLQHPEYAAHQPDLALWNLRGGQEHHFTPLSPEQEMSFQDELLKAAEQAASGPWTPETSHCSRCAWARNCLFIKAQP